MCQITTDKYQTDPQMISYLAENGFLIRSPAKGIYGFTKKFEAIVQIIQDIISSCVENISGFEKLAFPPIMSVDSYNKTNHLELFPNLVGALCGYAGDKAQHMQMLAAQEENKDWASGLGSLELVMVPAACYPVYPALKGKLQAPVRKFDLLGQIFRNEPSDEISRLQSFRQRELLCVGDAALVDQHREVWLQLAPKIFECLGLPVEIVEANDPFFGRKGGFMAATQRQQKLKYEAVVSICSGREKTAIASFNVHGNYFGSSFDIFGVDGDFAHSSCVGFGLERIAMAVISEFQYQLDAWLSERNEKNWHGEL
ncbi:MAG: hypothetical protein PHP57_13555 [Sideroxydans sp.]|nr:hypothetical protein [Sideroxydans sp.]